jgi:NADH dehydrogenase
MKIFIAGGTGFVGGHLCRCLINRGHTIRLLVRNRSGIDLEGIERHEGDIFAPETLAAPLAGCDAVINLIGIIRESPGQGVTFEKLHVEATRTMLAATEQAGIRRYLQMSALGTRPDAVSAYHRTKWRGEELVRNSGLDWTIFRPSVIFGPGDSFVTMLADLIVKLPLVPVIGNGRYRLQPIAASDVALCFSMALEMPATTGCCYELCGPDRLSYNDMLDQIGTALGRSSVPKLHNPLRLMTLVTPFLQRFPFYPVTMDQIHMLLEENICDSSWRQSFDFTPTRFSEGISSYLGGV